MMRHKFSQDYTIETFQQTTNGYDGVLLGGWAF